MRVRLAVIFSLIVLLSACGLGEIKRLMRPTVSGEIVLNRANRGDAHWKPDVCGSGDRQYFLGFDLSSTREDWRIRALVDPIAGAALRLTSGQTSTPGDIVLHGADCQKFDVRVDPTGWNVNDIRDISGHLELQCVTVDGTRIEGHIDVDHCH